MKVKVSKPQVKCPHGYVITNSITQASSTCWNLECRWNG